MRRRPNKSAAASTSHTAPDPAEFNAVWRTKSNLLSQTNSNATPIFFIYLFIYLLFIANDTYKQYYIT